MSLELKKKFRAGGMDFGSHQHMDDIESNVTNESIAREKTVTQNRDLGISERKSQRG